MGDSECSNAQSRIAPQTPIPFRVLNLLKSPMQLVYHGSPTEHTIHMFNVPCNSPTNLAPLIRSSSFQFHIDLFCFIPHRFIKLFYFMLMLQKPMNQMKSFVIYPALLTPPSLLYVLFLFVLSYLLHQRSLSNILVSLRYLGFCN